MVRALVVVVAARFKTAAALSRRRRNSGSKPPRHPVPRAPPVFPDRSESLDKMKDRHGYYDKVDLDVCVMEGSPLRQVASVRIRLPTFTTIGELKAVLRRTPVRTATGERPSFLFQVGSALRPCLSRTCPKCAMHVEASHRSRAGRAVARRWNQDRPRRVDIRKVRVSEIRTAGSSVQPQVSHPMSAVREPCAALALSAAACNLRGVHVEVRVVCFPILCRERAAVLVP